jgi:hypothetical protein
MDVRLVTLPQEVEDAIEQDAEGNGGKEVWGAPDIE